MIVQGIGIHTGLNNMCVCLFCDFIGFLEHVPFLSRTQHDGTETSISKKIPLIKKMLQSTSFNFRRTGFLRKKWKHLTHNLGLRVRKHLESSCAQDRGFSIDLELTGRRLPPAEVPVLWRAGLSRLGAGRHQPALQNGETSQPPYKRRRFISSHGNGWSAFVT